MAQIPINLFHKWQDTEVVHAADYVLERDSIVTALNDADSKGNNNKSRLDAAEEQLVTHTNQISLKTDYNGNHGGSWQGKQFFDVESLFATISQKYDGAKYLVSPNGFKFQVGVNDDGTIFTQDYDGIYSQWFNPISANGTKWGILIDDDGSVNTMELSPSVIASGGSELYSNTGVTDWDDITNKPTTFTPSTHVHAIATALVDGFMSIADKVKLDGIAANANNYVHPANHSPSIITQDSNNRFVTDAEKTTWNGKQAPATTLSGYGITNAYTKTEVDAKVPSNKITVSSTQPSSPSLNDIWIIV